MDLLIAALALLTLFASVVAAYYGYRQFATENQSAPDLEIRYFPDSGTSSITMLIENVGGRSARNPTFDLFGFEAVFKGSENTLTRMRLHTLKPGDVERCDLVVTDGQPWVRANWRDTNRPTHVTSAWSTPVRGKNSEELERQRQLSQIQRRKERREHQWIVGPFAAPAGTATPRQLRKQEASNSKTDAAKPPKTRSASKEESRPDQ